jgi:alanyl-tRNA synthetase
VTDRLYYRDAVLLEFDAIVIEHAGDAQHVVLDRTAFYPTSGGQPHDTGLLGPARVTDVIDDGERIVHVTAVPVPLGATRGAIDSARRRDHMQQHTAQHLLSALAADRLKWETVSVHFGADHSTIEFASASISDRQLADLERWTNDIVAEARAVTVSFEDAAAAENAGLRKPSGRSGEIRVIAIAGIDRSACGGTHVSRSSEIGPVVVLGTEKVRGNTRVGFLAGDRVLAHTRAGDATLAALAREVGCAVDELGTLIPARQLELKATRDQVVKLEQEVAASRVDAMRNSTAPAANGLRRITYRAHDESATMLRAMAQAIAPLERTLFAAIGGSPATIYFATSADSGVDAGATLKAALAATGGRGGGSARVAQGTAASVDVLEQIAREVLNG